MLDSLFLIGEPHFIYEIKRLSKIIFGNIPQISKKIVSKNKTEYQEVKFSKNGKTLYFYFELDGSLIPSNNLGEKDYYLKKDKKISYQDFMKRENLIYSLFAKNFYLDDSFFKRNFLDTKKLEKELPGYIIDNIYIDIQKYISSLSCQILLLTITLKHKRNEKVIGKIQSSVHIYNPEQFLGKSYKYNRHFDLSEPLPKEIYTKNLDYSQLAESIIFNKESQKELKKMQKEYEKTDFGKLEVIKKLFSEWSELKDDFPLEDIHKYLDPKNSTIKDQKELKRLITKTTQYLKKEEEFINKFDLQWKKTPKKEILATTKLFLEKDFEMRKILKEQLILRKKISK